MVLQVTIENVQDVFFSNMVYNCQQYSVTLTNAKLQILYNAVTLCCCMILKLSTLSDQFQTDLINSNQSLP